jgi:pilus assembly protein CpaB
MNKRFAGVLVFALVVSFVASFLVYRLIVGQIGRVGRAHQQQIVVAARDLPIGTLIQASDVKAVDWSGSAEKNWARNSNEVIGRGVVQAVYAGEPLAESRLAQRGAGGGLAATIPPGKRAVAVRVNDVIGVGGFAVPGMRVDVLISGVPPQLRQAALGTQTRFPPARIFARTRKENL